ncbi:hypothetical protein ACIBH1_06055 [Nonomuraea sp. NPDC050663]|uniref:hypothetical protein n=1 Tax=Nonomuraea sp. NPDC050663 TaxID=3364370 RepID=UPI003797313B
MIRAVGIGVAATTGLLAALTYVTFSVPGTHFVAALMLVYAWALLGLIWPAALAVTLALRAGRADLRLSWPVWAASPVIVAFAAAAVYFGVPERLRFELSRPALETLAMSVVSEGDKEPGWTGLFPLRRAEAVPGGARFLVEGTGFLDPCGYAWSPNGRPPVIGEDHYEHLSGPWYRWRESW